MLTRRIILWGSNMEMIPTIKPYGAVNIKEIESKFQKGDNFYFIDNYGVWKISKETYDYLEYRGVPDYVKKAR